MKSHFLLSAAVLAVASAAFGSGFSLYEPSTVSHAMGGALVGRAMDASANYNNPATLTDLTNIEVTVGFVTEHPRCQVRVMRNHVGMGDQNMDPGLFWLPHFQLAVPLPYGFAFGLGGSAEYGLGTLYDDNWAMDWNTRQTDVQGYVLNPNLAYKITDSWSLGLGARWLYFDFEQTKDPITPSGPVAYRMKGDNRFESVGWQVGMKYDILDNLSVGVVYKAPIEVNVRGTSSARPLNTTLANAATAMALCGSADASLTLPQSVSAGVNWDITPKWHLGFAASWTQWSEFDTLVFNVKPQRNPVKLQWNDTWRASLGAAYDFADDWTAMMSYTFDMDCCLDGKQDSAMLPPAHRNILGAGLRWRCWRGLELALSYACIFTDGGSMDTADAAGNDYHLETCRGFCHAAGFSVTYRF